MSSYLSFFIVPKRKSPEEPKQHIIIASYSRSTELYQYFDENIHPVWAGNGEKYTPITIENLTLVLNDFNNDIDKAKNRLAEYEKYAPKNPDYIQEIIDTKEYIKDLEVWRNKLTFLGDMLDDMPCYENIEEICCHIS